MITVKNTWAQVVGPERAAIGGLLRFRKKGYQFTAAYKRGWDGYVHLMNEQGRFPAGLVPYIVNQLTSEWDIKYPLEITDERTRPEACDALKPAERIGHQLMDHQLRAVEVAWRAGRGIIEHSVGSGKSTVGVELIRRCAVPALILVHTKELLKQMMDNLQSQLNIPGLLGSIGGGNWDHNWITVATYQSLRDTSDPIVKGFLATRQLILVDEVHHLVAKTFEKILQAAPNAFFRYGLSATPFKSHNKGGSQDMETFLKVMGWTGPVVSRFSEEEGVEVGRLVTPDVFVVDYGAGPNPLAWPEAYEVGLVWNQDRNSAIAQLAEASPHPVLILVERIEHGEFLAKLLRNAYYLEAKFISGRDTAAVRNHLIDRLRGRPGTAHLQVLVSSVILDEGVDIPNIRTLILAGGGKAQHRIIQRIGRGMRAVEGKHRLLVFDFADRGKYLGAHARKRQLLYEREPAYTVSRLGLVDTIEALIPGETGARVSS